MRTNRQLINFILAVLISFNLISCTELSPSEIREKVVGNTEYEVSLFKYQVGIQDIVFSKVIYVKKNNSTKKFSPKKQTQLDITRIIIGKTKPNTILFNKGIDTIIVFPNELEILEGFDYNTLEYINDFKGEDLIHINYYSDNTLDSLMNDLEVLIDVKF